MTAIARDESDPPMNARRLLLGLSVLVLIAGGTAGAADAPKAPAPPPCCAAEHRQFDFRLGDWEVRDPAGKVVGRNRITWQALPDGRVRQLWETSTERGVTWKTAFDGFYRKQK